jgi:hypothetical protein
MISAANPHLPKIHGGAKRDFVLGTLALIALVAAELMLVVTIPGTNYVGGDGKAAQATILATLEFAEPFDVSNLDPLQGIGSQMAPMNVWVNPAYWPFAFFDKTVAAAISGVVALTFYAIACYLMARCYDVPRLPSIVAAQLCVILFGPVVLALEFAGVFATIPGLAIVYAPHLVAFGLLARVSPARPQVFIIAGGLLMLLFLSLYCDPLWTLVSALAWVVPFAVVTLSPFRRDLILARCAVLGGCLAVLFLSGALEYVYTLSQYTARVQFAEVLQRPRLPDHASILFTSWAARYFYSACVLGWLFGLWLQRGRAHTLVLAGAVSGVASLAYSAAYLLLDGTWSPPRPILIEHALFPLFVAAAITGYWSALEALATLAHHRMRLLQVPSFPPWQAAAVAMAVLMAAFVPAAVIVYAVTFPKSRAHTWYEPWPNEPELRQFFGDTIGLHAGRRFGGSVYVLGDGAYGDLLTMANLWVEGVPTPIQYGQLVTPQAIYFIHEVLKKDLTFELNWFRPWIGQKSWPTLIRTFRALGVRYVALYDPFEPFDTAHLQSTSLLRRSLSEGVGHWVVYELPDVNVGNYSPTEMTIAQSGAEISARLGAAKFDFTRQVVLLTTIAEPLVPARDMQLSVIRGGLHLSGHSDSTSVVVLPQQFSHCLRARDDRVRLVRANLMMTGVIFSGDIDTDIVFDYGVFTPRCRWADISDIKQLEMQIDARRVPLSGDGLFPNWETSIAKLRAAASALK